MGAQASITLAIDHYSLAIISQEIPLSNND